MIRSIPRSARETSLSTTFVASGAIQGLNVVTGILLARSLGVEGRGQLAAILLWTMLVGSAGALGLPEAVVYEVTRTKSVPRVVGAAFRAWIVQSAVLMAIGAVVVTFALRGYDVSVRESAFVFLLFVPLYLATNLEIAVLQGLGALRAFNLVRTLIPALTAGVLTALALIDRLTVRTAVVTYIGSYLITTVVAFGALHAAHSWGTRSGPQVTRRLLAYGIRSHSSFLASTVNERLDQMLISIVLGAPDLGLYVVAVTMTSLTTLASSTVGLVAFPRMAALEAGPKRAATARRYVRLSLVLSLAVVVPLLALTPQLLRLLFGEGFVAATNVCRVLLVASVALALAQLLVALLRGAGRPLSAGAGSTAGLIVTVVSLPPLLLWLGLMGAAISSLAAYLVSAAWMARRLAAVLEIPAIELLLEPAAIRDIGLERF